jgi:hypothetical protein
LPKGGKNQPIAEQLPLKQGLKLSCQRAHLFIFLIAEQLPLKQGLKL